MRRFSFFIIFLLLVNQALAIVKINSDDLGFTVDYETKEIQVSDTKILLKHEIKPFANIDYLGVKVGDTIMSPTSAKQKGKSVLNKIQTIDYDVIDMHEPIQITLPSTGTLLIHANEHESAGPVTYPVDSLLTVDVTPGSFTFDGSLDTSLTEPSFEFWWVPTTGHPPGMFIGYVRGDENYLYFAFDVTPDNTNDVNEDWAAIYLQTDSGATTYYADHAKKEYGLSSFQYTPAVTYEHKVYEFKIPREAGISTQTNTISFYIQYYGTAGGPICGNGIIEAPEECDDGNTAPGDGCSATCMLEPTVPEFSTITMIIAVLGALVSIFAFRRFK